MGGRPGCLQSCVYKASSLCSSRCSDAHNAGLLLGLRPRPHTRAAACMRPQLCSSHRSDAHMAWLLTRRAEVMSAAVAPVVESLNQLLELARRVLHLVQLDVEHHGLRPACASWIQADTTQSHTMKTHAKHADNMHARTMHAYTHAVSHHARPHHACSYHVHPCHSRSHRACPHHALWADGDGCWWVMCALYVQLCRCSPVAGPPLLLSTLLCNCCMQPQEA
eukprot:354922-Chlamydomonas_euryale.AAC.7